MDTPLLTVRNLEAWYGPVQAVKGVSFDVRRGEIITLLGANGAGKSTTLMCVSGIHGTWKGSVQFDGVDISKLKAHEIVRLGMAQVPEGRRVFSKLSVRENLLLGAYTRRDPAEIKSGIDHVCSLFPILGERAQQPAGTLSGGEQQMLSISRALLSKPKMLLLDEPSMGIAPLLVRSIFETLETLNKSGITICLIEQNANLALRIAHRAYVLETGTITIEGDAKTLAEDERVREAYLGA